MLAITVVFFVPELVKIFGSSILFNVEYMRRAFWQAMNTREKSGVKRDDYMDLLIKLKNGEQNDIYSKYLITVHLKIIFIK